MNAYSLLTDSELLAALREGHARAFDEIYNRYVEKLFGYVRTRVNDREECREIVQDVFETFIKSKAKVRELGPYLFGVLKFRIIKYYEHKTVVQKFSTYMQMFERELSVVDDSDSEIETLRGMIDHSLTSLPPRCQDAVKLRIDENMSLDDIALRLKVNRESVERYLTMAMNHFRKVHAPIYRAK